MITFTRIFISPIFLLLYLEHEAIGITDKALPYFLLILLSVSELSDAFDGFFARKFNQVTNLGKILDPMADSIARTSVFLTFTLPPVKVPMLVIFVFIYRDSVISTLRTVCALRGYALAARISGKVKAVLQAIAAFIVVILMIPFSLGKISNETLTNVSTWLIGITAFYAFCSGLDYIYANRDYIKKLLVEKKTRV